MLRNSGCWVAEMCDFITINFYLHFICIFSLRRKPQIRTYRCSLNQLLSCWNGGFYIGLFLKLLFHLFFLQLMILTGVPDLHCYRISGPLHTGLISHFVATIPIFMTVVCCTMSISFLAWYSVWKKWRNSKLWMPIFLSLLQTAHYFHFHYSRVP